MSDGMEMLSLSPMMTVTSTALLGRSMLNVAYLLRTYKPGDTNMEFLNLDASIWALMVVIPTLIAWAFLKIRYNSSYTAWVRSKTEKYNAEMKDWIAKGCEGEKPVPTDTAYGKEYKVCLLTCVVAGTIVSVLFAPVVGYIVEDIVSVPDMFRALLYVGIAIILTIGVSVYLDVKVAHGAADGTGDAEYIAKGKLYAQTLEDTAKGILAQKSADKMAGQPKMAVDPESFYAWMQSAPWMSAVKTEEKTEE